MKASGKPRADRAVERVEDALGQQEVAEQRGHKQILPEQLVEQLPRKHVPGNAARGQENKAAQASSNRLNSERLACR